MKRIIALTFLASAVALQPAFALNAGSGSNGGAFLASETGVRASGMGGAFTAVADDASALYNNPAGLGTLGHVELTAFSQDLQQDISQRDFALIIPLSEATSSNVSKFGSLGVSFGSLDFGALTGRDAAGAPLPDFKAHDYLWTFGYGKGWYDTFYLGVNYKRYEQRIADKRASNDAIDIGALYRLSTEWTLGANLKNQGGKLSYVTAEESMPRTAIVAVAYKPFKEALTLSMDVEKPNNEASSVQTGIEWWATRTIALRAGYDSGNGVNGSFTFGAGLRLLDFEAGWFPIQRLSLDYAFIPGSSVSGLSGDTVDSRQNIALTMRFGDR